MRNMGLLDRRVRGFVIAPLLLVIGVLVGPVGVASIILYVLAAVMAATSAVGVCPLYAPFRLSTGAGKH
ncbi:YgaP family membrane protein [Nocardioides bruguierae]|uniref:DUF2892 domain-containing protein n=1 Tax=Nocardioides bruguierae TaxID=2945102 RepID=A0A9X2IEM0_9ACTN|nr:DUF2892 domain-containing protein [Nocardioides bruguierae]MCM0619494.1 DUF2892 domain-containing protein [Nocardioides bruguierae]